MSRTIDRLTAVSLGCGVAVPFLYFGMQLAAAPFYPGYSFVRQTASELGASGSTMPMVLNAGAITTGIATLIASFGFWRGLRHLQANGALTFLTTLALVVSGVVSIRAGLFPLPDPRHNPGPLAILTFLFPAFLLAALWKRKDARALKVYLLASTLVIVVFVPIMGGKVGVDIREVRGLAQRVFAFAAFVPIGVGSWALLKRYRQPI